MTQPQGRGESGRTPIHRWLSALFEIPAFRKAPGLAVKVLLVLIRHRNPGDSLAFPGHATIAKTLGMEPGPAARRSVTRAAQWLVDNNLVTAERKWHKGRTRLVYRVPWLDSMQRSASAPTVTPDQGSAGAPTPNGAPVPDQGSAGAPGDGAPALPPSEEGVEEGREEATPQGAAATAGQADRSEQRAPDAEVVRLLRAARIGDPNRDKFARDPRVTVAIVNRAVESCRESGLGTGALVNRIRDFAEGDSDMPRQTAEKAAENRAAFRTGRYDAALGYMTPEQLDRLPENWRTVAGLVAAHPLGDDLGKVGPLDTAFALLTLAAPEATTAA